jgi:hypothetical protein
MGREGVSRPCRPSVRPWLRCRGVCLSDGTFAAPPFEPEDWVSTMDEISIASMVPRSVCAATKTGWLWYCDVCDEHGHAGTRRRATALSRAHETSDVDSEHDLYVWEAGATRVWDPSQGEGRTSPWKRNWQVRMHSNVDNSTRTLSFKTEDEALQKAYDYVRGGGECYHALVHDKSASLRCPATETQVFWWHEELVAMVNPAAADESEAVDRVRNAMNAVCSKGPHTDVRIPRLVDES